MATEARTLTFMEAMDLTGVHEPAMRGPWTIEQRTISQDEADFSALRSAIQGSGRHVPVGTYTGLKHRGIVIMSDTPDERRDHREPFSHAAGRCLVHGLGLGMLVRAILLKPNVEHVDVVELDEDVIELCGPPIRELGGDRLTIHHGDAYTFRFPPGTYWSMVWHDVWDTINEDNLEGIAKLKRRYGGRCDWQGAWVEHLLRAQRDRHRGYW